MKILLVRPDLVDSPYSLYNLGLRHTPLGLLSLGTCLKQAGHEVILCDEIVGDRAEEDIAAHHPDMVGISVSSPIAGRAVKISHQAMEQGAKVVLGGPHISTMPEESLLETGAHLAAVREGEDTLVEIASGGRPGDIKGLVYRDGDEFVHTGFRDLVLDLDTIPIPDMSLLDWRKYEGDSEYGLPRRPGWELIRVITSRGCASHCTFCSRHKIFTRQTRFRSPENVMEEIRAGMAVRKVNNLVFMDDTFTENFEHAEQISRALIKARLNLHWAAITKVGIPKDLLRLMHQAGCQVVELGVESGSQRVLDHIKKDITIPNVIQTFSDAREVGMRTKAFFMVGLPGEEQEDFEASVALARKINPDYLWLSIFLPLPGSAVFDSQSGANANYRDRNFIHSHDPELQRRFRMFLRKFYLRAGYLPVILKNYRGYLDMAGKLKSLRLVGKNLSSS